MIDQETFRNMCDDFYKHYVLAKKNISLLERLVQRQITPIEKEISSSLPVECRSGCAHCCQLRVVALPHELITIYLYIKKEFSGGKVQAIKERIKKQFEVIKGLTQDEHYTINVQCPLRV